MKKKLDKRQRLKAKIRSRIFGTSSMPRLSVFKSNKFTYAQLIDDEKKITIAFASDMDRKKGTKSDGAKEVGKTIASRAVEHGVKKVVFDRNGFNYTGRIKALADEARKGGLNF